ncbi:MAG: hypoxanthine phosphoribosyltransferase [Acidimicrobiales bacterium]|nr:hypoxanthine phosphoribosyltransferase [Acidimicrobiales bacterium]
MSTSTRAELGGSPAMVPPPTILASRGDLRRTVQRLGAELSQAYPSGVVLISVLKGSLLFLADLCREITSPVTVDFLSISSYAPGTGRVRIVKDLDLDISGRDVVLVEDIVDTGLTLGFLLSELRRREPASLEVCALTDKAARRILPTHISFRGFEVPDVFVIGYGLDFAGRYRNLDLVAGGSLEVLTTNPDAYVPHLYGITTRD